jgi:hypothetical protein
MSTRTASSTAGPRKALDLSDSSVEELTSRKMGAISKLDFETAEKIQSGIEGRLSGQISETLKNTKARLAKQIKEL